MSRRKRRGEQPSIRDCWCTPRWFAEAIAPASDPVDIDPCCNDRCHIAARTNVSSDYGGDGLAIPVSPPCRVFVNPPYSRGSVLAWVRRWLPARFVFLVRYDPSTEWFRELIAATTHLWFPAARVNFEPPPGVEASSVTFPHALFMRDPSDELLARLRRATAPNGRSGGVLLRPVLRAVLRDERRAERQDSRSPARRSQSDHA